MNLKLLRPQVDIAEIRRKYHAAAEPQVHRGASAESVTERKPECRYPSLYCFEHLASSRSRRYALTPAVLVVSRYLETVVDL